MWWNGDGMHGWGWHGFFAWPMLLFLLVIALAGYGLYSLGRSAGERRRPRPVDELTERYLRGEIDDETFRQRLRALRDVEGGGP